MYTIQITTIGEVALDSNIDSNLGYKYDVPLDAYGVPYIPIYKLIDFKEEVGVDVKLGFDDGTFSTVNQADIGFLAPEGSLIDVYKKSDGDNTEFTYVKHEEDSQTPGSASGGHVVFEEVMA